MNSNRAAANVGQLRATAIPTYSPGHRIIVRDEEWMVKKVEKNHDVGQLRETATQNMPLHANERMLHATSLHCTGISPLVKGREVVFIVDLETIEPIDPSQIKFIPDDSSFFFKSRLYIESQLRQKIPTTAELQIGHKAAMDTMNYQLLPAQVALGKTRQRILIADSVGLGKTLEAGILVSELIARGKGNRILVVTTKSMMTQFQKEFWNRFTVPLVRLDSQKIQRIKADLPANYSPFVKYDKSIVSIDTIKRDIEYRTHIENSWWDIIIIDEAQNVAERGNQAQRARLAKLLSEKSDTLIMLTATPHDGRSESFASLMNMLDPTAIANPKNYTKEEDCFISSIRLFCEDLQAVYFESIFYFV